MPLIINGLGVSRGIAQGRVHLLKRSHSNVTRREVPKEQIPREVERIREGIEAAREKLGRIRDMAREDVRGFIEAHLLMLDDAMLVDMSTAYMQEHPCNAEWALEQTREKLVREFLSMDDPYLRTRCNDVSHVIRTILECMDSDQEEEPEAKKNLTGSIIVADDLTPADTVSLRHQNIAAFVTQYGSSMSHTAVLARSLGIPAVVGTHNAADWLREGEDLLIDGRGGTLLCATGEWLIDHYRDYQRRENEHQEALETICDQPSITRDNHTIELLCNLDLVESIEHIHEVNADGIGLYRTEFFYLDRAGTKADTEEQYHVYRDLVHRLQGKPLTIRTLDLGADKEFDPDYQGVVSPNPALGLRAIRRSLQDKPTFLAQLAAILRASAHGPVQLMLPMLTTASELRDAQALIRRCMDSLKREGHEYDADIKIGGMIEVPAAALNARFFAHELDFLSIGTNDLIQYTLAIDRVDNQVNYLYDPLHPAVLRLIHFTIKAGREAGAPVAMCGEMASNPSLTRLLLGLGLREFSVSPTVLLEIKQIIRLSSMERLKERCKKILMCSDSGEVSDMVARLH